MRKIIVNGCFGKLGHSICTTEFLKQSGCEVVAGIDARVDAFAVPFPVFADIESCHIAADVVIDCSIAAVVPRVLDYCVAHKLPVVVCTTGLNDAVTAQLTDASKHIAVFKSANMSLGVNLLINLLQKAAPLLAETGFDIEIIEKHHNLKKDAPSGTALMLADSINDVLDERYEYRYDRTEADEPRVQKEIGIHTLRGGTIVGEHTVVFAGKDEVIELTHIAQSKELFAVGAIKAALHIAEAAKGLYNMQHIMES